jgi:hypothetical protein
MQMLKWPFWGMRVARFTGGWHTFLGLDSYWLAEIRCNAAQFCEMALVSQSLKVTGRWGSDKAT